MSRKFRMKDAPQATDRKGKEGLWAWPSGGKSFGKGHSQELGSTSLDSLRRTGAGQLLGFPTIRSTNTLELPPLSFHGSNLYLCLEKDCLNRLFLCFGLGCVSLLLEEAAEMDLLGQFDQNRRGVVFCAASRDTRADLVNVERCVHDGFSFVSFCIKNHRIKKKQKMEQLLYLLINSLISMQDCQK